MATGDLITNARLQDNLNNYGGTANETTTQNDQITAVSRAIKKFCKRDFVSTSYDELYNGNGQRRLVLHRFPILAVASVRYRPVTVLKIQNTDQATNQRATVAVTSTGLTLTRVASGAVTTDTTSTYASYATLQALASHISGIAGGWTAQVVGSTTGDYGLWPAADLYVPPTFSDGTQSQGALTCRGEFAELKMHTMELAGYQWDARGWLLRAIPYTDPELLHPEDLIWPIGIGNFRVQYTAGFNTVPQDVQEACAQWVSALFWQTKRDVGLATATIGSLTSHVPFSTMPPGVLELLLPYRDHKIEILGD
jgi:hypothetical protein